MLSFTNNNGALRDCYRLTRGSLIVFTWVQADHTRWRAQQKSSLKSRYQQRSDWSDWRIAFTSRSPIGCPRRQSHRLAEPDKSFSRMVATETLAGLGLKPVHVSCFDLKLLLNPYLFHRVSVFISCPSHWPCHIALFRNFLLYRNQFII